MIVGSALARLQAEGDFERSDKSCNSHRVSAEVELVNERLSAESPVDPIRRLGSAEVAEDGAGSRVEERDAMATPGAPVI